MIAWLFWFTVLAATTAGMLRLRDRLNEAHVALAFLVIVQVASARRGRPLGLTLAVAAFLAFDWLFLPPYNTLVVADPLNWLVLVAFFGTAVLASQLLHRAQAEAEDARRRAAEVDRLSVLGAETLNAGRADDALIAVAAMIRSTLGLDACAIYQRAPDGSVRIAAATPLLSSPDAVPELVGWVAVHGAPAAERLDLMRSAEYGLGGSEDATAILDGHATRTLLLPLRVRGRTVGVLSAQCLAGLALDPAKRRFLMALAYYAALGVERVRLIAEAERAEALRESARLKDAVLASVSHDLRTPLTTIKALAHDLADSGDERAETIELEADRLTAFVADLLELSRLNSGTVTLRLETNEAEDLIGAAVQRVSAWTGDRPIVVELDPEHPLLFGKFDFTSTLRALVNLLENALKYSPAGEKVILRVRREDTSLSFAVLDRGAGVTAEERERIFEPFYRRPNSVPDVGGAGLGLSIARGLAEAQGGTLAYEPRDGGGSVFTLRVPAMDASLFEGALGDD